MLELVPIPTDRGGAKTQSAEVLKGAGGAVALDAKALEICRAALVDRTGSCGDRLGCQCRQPGLQWQQIMLFHKPVESVETPRWANQSKAMGRVSLDLAPEPADTPLGLGMLRPAIGEERLDSRVAGTLANSREIGNDFLCSVLVERVQEAEVAVLADPQEDPLP